MVVRRLTAIVLAAVVFAIAAPCFAQSERGSITGVIQDTSKAAVPGVSVKVINTATNAVTDVVSSETGAYSATNLSPGTYRIEASLTGFQTAKTDGVRLTAGATARVDIVLNLGAIERVGHRPGQLAAGVRPRTRRFPRTCRTNRSTSSRSSSAARCAACSTWSPPCPNRRAAARNVVLGGGQGGAFGATLDGISVNTNRDADTTETAFLTPSVEAITEFAVETNGFKPEFGQAGGGAITFASKSGTKQFHGSVYNFLRNDALDRKGFFEPTKGIYRQNNFGAVLGRAGADPGRVQRQEPDVLLRRLRRLPEPPGVECADAERADAGNVQRRFFELGGQPGPEDHRSTIRRPRVPIPTAPGSSAIPSRATSFPPPVSAPSRSNTSRSRGRRSSRIARASCPARSATCRTTICRPAGRRRKRPQKYSVKIDHALSNTHRLSYLFNRGEQPAPARGLRSGGPSRCPSTRFNPRASMPTFIARRWDWIGSRDGESPDVRHQHIQQGCVLAERRPGLEEQGLHSECGRLQREHGHRLRSPSSRRGGEPPTTARSSRGSRSKTT